MFSSSIRRGGGGGDGGDGDGGGRRSIPDPSTPQRLWQQPTSRSHGKAEGQEAQEAGEDDAGAARLHAATRSRRRPGPWPPTMDGFPHPPKPCSNADRGIQLPEITSANEISRLPTPPYPADACQGSIPKPPGYDARIRRPEKPASRKNADGSKENAKVAAKESVKVREASPVVNDAGLPVSLPSIERKGHSTNGLLPIKIMEPPFRVSKEPQGMDAVLLKEQSPVKYELRESPGLVPLILYGFQHYLSITGSIVFIPLIIVPAMGGRDEDTARVVSTVLLLTGLSTLMHTFLGSRLPLIQGASFVYLAPALTIINSTELQSIGTNRFEHTMRELQGAIIIASAFQAFLGYSGFMSILVRLINPVVVTPTVASVGLAFFSYAFPVVGSCVEIGIPQILVLIIFTLYLRKISVFGHHIFQVLAVPLSIGIIWAYAFLLTTAGIYNYDGCSVHVPSSNIISEKCRMHVSTMMHCRTDVSIAMKTASWFILPFPFQWGIPIFHWKTAFIMIVASVIASVNSVGSYHASSLLVASRPPPPGVVSRAIGMEGLTSILAGLWGIGTGATTLTENVHTIAVTKMGSRRAVEFGACVLILMSLVGKIGAFIASIPRVIVAALLCVMWSKLTAFGLSNLRYSETGSSRNAIIVGLSLFLSLSIPAYFQHYAAGFVPATVASYFLPYNVAAHGPFKTGIEGVDFVLNSILSMNMVIAFLVAFFLDNTVPGNRQERGAYLWTKLSTADTEAAVAKDYGLPPSIAKFFRWAIWVGL